MRSRRDKTCQTEVALSCTGDFEDTRTFRTCEASDLLVLLGMGTQSPLRAGWLFSPLVRSSSGQPNGQSAFWPQVIRRTCLTQSSSVCVVPATFEPSK
jgi:hypothetical protein